MLGLVFCLLHCIYTFWDFVPILLIFAMVLFGRIGAEMVKTKERKDICSLCLLNMPVDVCSVLTALNSNLNFELRSKPWFSTDVGFWCRSHPNGSGLMEHGLI